MGSRYPDRRSVIKRKRTLKKGLLRNGQKLANESGCKITLKVKYATGKKLEVKFTRDPGYNGRISKGKSTVRKLLEYAESLANEYDSRVGVLGKRNGVVIF